MAEGQPNGNGAVTKYRVDRLEHRLKNVEEGARLLSQFGERNNEQILVHGQRFQALEADVAELKPIVAEIAVVKSEVAQVTDTLRAARNAFFAAAGGLALLAAAIVFTPSP